MKTLRFTFFLWGIFSASFLAAFTPSQPQGGAWGGWSCSSLSSSGRWLATAGLQGDLGVWNPLDGNNLFLVNFPRTIFRAVAVGKDGRVVAGGEDGVLVTVTPGGVSSFLPKLPSTVRAVVLSGDGFWSACDDGILRLQDSAGKVLMTVETHRKGYIKGLALSADGFWLAAVGDDGRIEIRSTQDGRLIASWMVSKNWVRAVVATSQGWLCGDDDGNLGLWGPQGKLIVSYHLGTSIEVVATSRGGWTVGDLAGKIWAGSWSSDGVPGPPRLSWIGATGPIAGVVWSDDHWVTVGADGGLRAWSWPNGRLLGEILP